MKRSTYLVTGIFLGALLVSVAWAISSEVEPIEDPVKLSPQYYKVLLENDQVRVLEYHLKPGEKEQMHSHPAGVVYVLSGGKLKFSYPDGRTEEKAAATGETIWREPVTHAVENVGDTEAHAIAIDLKTPGRQKKVESRKRKIQ
jgi:quercetin dioxygenase-like cupin family protein